MACATTIGSHIFGVPADQPSLVVSSVQVTKKADKKEGRDKCGNVVGVAWYNPTTEATVEGMATNEPSQSVAGTYALSTVLGNGTFYIEEISGNYSNEDFAKFSFKLIKYS